MEVPAIRSRNQLGFAIDGILAWVVTHVHLDHVGRIPVLFSAGFPGPILCSEPSARLLPLVLEDAYRLQVRDEPTQVARYLEFLKQLIKPLSFGCWHTVVEQVDVQCSIRLRAPCNPFLRPVVPPERADVLVLESTYGDRMHPDRGERRKPSGLRMRLTVRWQIEGPFWSRLSVLGARKSCSMRSRAYA